MLHFSIANLIMYRIVFLILIVFASISCQKQDLALPKNYPIVCYVAAYNKGIYKSDNGGISWFPINTDQKKIHAYFKRIFNDPSQKDLLYIATTGAGLFTLNLQTEIFNKVSQFHAENVMSVAFRSSPFNQLNSKEIFVGLDNKGVYYSSDPFKAWQPYNTGYYFRMHTHNHRLLRLWRYGKYW